MNFNFFQEYIAERFSLLQMLIGKDVKAEETITSIMNGNPQLLRKYIKAPNIAVFVNLLQEHRESKYVFKNSV